MSPRRRTLTEPERNDWARFARDVRPLPGRADPELPREAGTPEPAASPVPAPRPAARSSPRAQPPPLGIGEQPSGVDQATWNRLRSGKLAPTRKLDLHGRTAQAAFQALHGFLQAAHVDRVRVVEVITGRGSGEAGGVIRRELPVWLNLPALRPLVLAATYPHPANPGAVRLLLRRPR
jgi:DNA-nicking Smr family endonuclease